MAEVIRWQCTNRVCRDKSRWWMSVWGVVQCMNCREPSFPELIVMQGTAADAPAVDPIRTNQAIEGPYGRPPVPADCYLHPDREPPA